MADLETSLFLHGFSFELELINNEHKCGPLHALMRHFHQFRPFLGPLTAEQQTVSKKFWDGALNDRFVEKNKEVLKQLQMKIVLFIKGTIRYNEQKRQYPLHKTGNKDKTLVTCWDITQSSYRLILVISGWKGYITRSCVVEKRALVTAYLMNDNQAMGKFSNLRYWFDDAGLVRITNINDMRNELREEGDKNQINPLPVLANIIDRTDVEFLPYLFKEQQSDILNLEQPGFVKTYLSTLHFGVLMEHQDLKGSNVPPHWRPTPKLGHDDDFHFQSIIALQFPLQGMLYSILRFGDRFKYLGIIKRDIIEIETMPETVRSSIAILRIKEKPYRKFYRWYATMDNEVFVTMTEFLQENDEVLNLQNEALANITKIFETPGRFIKNERVAEHNEHIKSSWSIGDGAQMMVLTLSKENLADNSFEKPFRKILRIEFENSIN